jgi:hypothetical protein
MAKKQTLFNLFNWLKDAGLKALVILLVVTAGFYAYAQIVWPGTEPNPVSGVVGMFVGESAAPFDGDKVRNYETATKACRVAHEGSHVCTPDEMINTYNHNLSLFSGVSDKLWINSGPPAYTETLSNDCSGWQVNTSNFYGAVWNFDGAPFVPNSAYIQPCSANYRFACCK